MLSVPQCIVDAKVNSTEVRYLWDEWASKREIYHREGDAQLGERLAGLSQRARMALANSVAEWILYRYQAVLDRPEPYHAIEAAWAGQADRRYLLNFDLPELDWSGPVKGVIRRTLTIVEDCVDLAWRNGETSHLVVQVANLARYVLPNTRAFEPWLADVISRVAMLSPAPPSGFLGRVVARQVIDRQISPEQSSEYFGQFLLSLARQSNPFVASAQTMQAWTGRSDVFAWNERRDAELEHQIASSGVESLYEARR